MSDRYYKIVWGGGERCGGHVRGVSLSAALWGLAIAQVKVSRARFWRQVALARLRYWQWRLGRIQ